MHDEPIDELMERYARDAVAFARKHMDVELDYSLASVGEVDAILQRFHENLPRGFARALRRGPSEEKLQASALMWGGYLGEAMRRSWGGTWVVPDDGAMANAVCLRLPNGSLTSPPARTYQRIAAGPGEGLEEYVRYVAQALR